MLRTGFGILKTSRINTDEAHTSTGSAKNRTPLFFPGQQRIRREHRQDSTSWNAG
ncbi:hypothetical protein ACKW6Q_17745 [Chryseobacterium kwangjuense]|uniref:Uncharacterized protein n=1 Tax=Chryseobacterium kwangjuense TaxID=267125 RepID=A0ABW9K9A5_9FLAO